MQKTLEIELAKEVEQEGVPLQGKSEDFIEGVRFMLDKIDEAPTVEERQHGEWKPLGQPDELGIHSWHICSNCSFRTTWHMVNIFHFCPNCGSDMRQKEGEKMIVSNCLNCGAALDITGHCYYCGTDNIIDREIEMNGKIVELLLVTKTADAVHYLPVVGRITTLNIRPNYNYFPTHCGLMENRFKESTIINFEFEGCVSEMRQKT